MNNEVAVIIGTELDVNISSPKRSVGRRLISNADFK